MLHYASNLETYNLQATDGELGKVKNWYLDDQNWVIRYAAVDTRKWLPGRKVILSPSALEGIDSDNNEIRVRHDKETVRNSPPLEESEGMSANYEESLNDYYGWSPYWAGGSLWGQSDIPMFAPPVSDQPQISSNKIDEISKESSYTLREVDEIKDTVSIRLKSSKLGEIDDLLIDEDNWKIRYFVIQSDDGYYLLSPDWIKSVDWVENEIYFDLEEKEVSEAGSFRSKSEISREEEREIYKKYYKAPYWE